MTAALSNEYDPSIGALAQACAITFQGNASNNLQQDAFFFLDNWYQEDLGVMATTPVASPFCLAVSDGVASSNHSQHCSKSVVKAISRCGVIIQSQRPMLFISWLIKPSIHLSGMVPRQPWLW